MLKNIWNWLTWQFYKGRANNLLAESTEVVHAMHSRQKLAYALNAVQLGSRIWTNPISNLIAPQMLILHVKMLIECPDKRTANRISHYGEMFKDIARHQLPKGFSPDYLTPANMGLAYAFWSLTRMLAIVYPGYGLKLDCLSAYDYLDRCSDSEALTRIATSVVASAAAAYGHERGVRAYGKRYREMIDYGRGLTGDTESNQR